MLSACETFSGSRLLPLFFYLRDADALTFVLQNCLQPPAIPSLLFNSLHREQQAVLQHSAVQGGRELLLNAQSAS